VGNPAGTLDLLGVDLVSPSLGWAVGDIDPRGIGGAIFHTPDGGRTWTPVVGRSEVFTSVHFVTPRTGWIAGYAGQIERTDDGGRTWQGQRRETGKEIFNSIWAVDDRHAWAAGVNGLVARTVDGATWTTVPTNVRSDLWAVRFVSAERGWIVGDAGVVLTTSDGGATWSSCASGVSGALHGLATTSATLAVAVGEAGAIVRTTDGKTWSPVQTGSSDRLNSIATADGVTFWAVGDNGVVLASHDSGHSWRKTPALAPVRLFAVAAAGPRQALAVGARGFVQMLQ
jgi:photosystem II stability/assembly factor-like uncharacterized protein